MDIIVLDYSDEHEKEWDSFVIENSCNGTFLQSRLFLNYHPKDRYSDCSLMFYEKNKLVAVCPACELIEDGMRIFSSHSGSTYGGLIISEDILRTEKIIILLDAFENYLENKKFTKCILKQTNPLMCNRKMDLLEFCLFFKKYIEYKELDIYIDYEKYDKENIVSNFSKLKKRVTKKCIEMGMLIEELISYDSIQRFHEILVDNLKKYNLQPYHTVEDLIDLKKRFPEKIQFWGCIYEKKIIAVSMVFLFNKSKCVHTHYLAADSEYNKESPMTYIYYKMIDIYKDLGYRTLSWGITTEHMGVEINKNLTNTKEEFGSNHNIVRVYEKYINGGKTYERY